MIYAFQHVSPDLASDPTLVSTSGRSDLSMQVEP
jgi:hypothetical protein